MDRELIRETPIFEEIEIQDVTEAEDDGSKLLKIKGTASRGDIFNKNKRMYPTKVLKKVAEQVQSSIKKGKFTGQLDHPSFFGGGGDLERTAIKFTNMWMEGADLKFTGNVIPTTPGKELEALLRAKVGVGMSTRGYGTLKPYKHKNGREDKEKAVIQDDFELYGVDAVLNESNQYGKIAHYENKKGGTNMDLKTLKEDHPELVDELKKEMKEDLEKDFDQRVSEKVEKDVEAKVAEQKEELRKEVMESDEVKQMREFVDNIVESIKPLMPGQKEYEESKLQTEVDDLKAKLESAEADKDKAVKEAAELKAEQDKAAEKAKVAEHVEKKVEGHRFAEQLRNKLSECASVEEVDSKFEQEVAYIESLISNVDEPKGTGQTSTREDDDSTKDEKLDEEKQRQRKLAGIEDKKGGK